MTQISETEAFRACRVLFGNGLILKPSFLQYLQPSGAHSAFRKKAKVTHPDANHQNSQNPHRQVQLFQDLNQAHQLLQDYLRQRDLFPAQKRSHVASKKTQPTGADYRAPTYQNPGQGLLPTRPLPFGLYLYYRGFIPYSALIEALIWQRKQRPAFGQIAQRWGWLEKQEIDQICACHKQGRFGERAAQLGLLSSVQVRAILLHQRTLQSKLGCYFVEQGLLSAHEIPPLLEDQAKHNARYRHGYPNHFYYHR